MGAGLRQLADQGPRLREVTLADSCLSPRRALRRGLDLGLLDGGDGAVDGSDGGAARGLATRLPHLGERLAEATVAIEFLAHLEGGPRGLLDAYPALGQTGEAGALGIALGHLADERVRLLELAGLDGAFDPLADPGHLRRRPRERHTGCGVVRGVRGGLGEDLGRVRRGQGISRQFRELGRRAGNRRGRERPDLGHHGRRLAVQGVEPRLGLVRRRHGLARTAVDRALCRRDAPEGGNEVLEQALGHGCARGPLEFAHPIGVELHALFAEGAQARHPLRHPPGHGARFPNCPAGRLERARQRLGLRPHSIDLAADGGATRHQGTDLVGRALRAPVGFARCLALRPGLGARRLGLPREARRLAGATLDLVRSIASEPRLLLGGVLGLDRQLARRARLDRQGFRPRHHLFKAGDLASDLGHTRSQHFEVARE